MIGNRFNLADLKDVLPIGAYFKVLQYKSRRRKATCDRAFNDLYKDSKHPLTFSFLMEKL